MSDHNWGGPWGPGAPAIHGKSDKETIADLERENARLREALEIIAGKKQCLNNLMGDKDVALAALKGST